MKISVIIPVYNIQQYIETCLESVMKQDCCDYTYEVIVVDDGSSDDSGKIIDRVSSSYENMIVIHKPNGGVSSARNIGLERASGEYVWFVDGDDIVAANSIDLIVEHIRKTNNPDIACIGVKAFEDGERICNWALDISEETEKYADWIVTWIIKRRVIEDNGIRFDVNVSYGEDDIFSVWVRRQVHTTAKLNKVLYFYRQREGSALHTKISDESFERIIKTYRADLEYATRYSFFEYKRVPVYRGMQYVMAFVAKKNLFDALNCIRRLRKMGLFPLDLEGVLTDDVVSEERTSGAKRLRQRSCTYVGFLKLWCYMRIRNYMHSLRNLFSYV